VAGLGRRSPCLISIVFVKEAPKPETRDQRALHGQKPPLKPREVWAIRTRLQIQGKRRELALFNLAIDSKLQGLPAFPVLASFLFCLWFSISGQYGTSVFTASLKQ